MSSEGLLSAGNLPTDALSVGELTTAIRGLLEDAFGRVRVHGEVVSLARPGSGHVYFHLKDEDGRENGARVSAVLWRDRARRLRFLLEEGQRVVVEGRLTVYAPRGTYQIVAESVRPAGQGALLLALERLKERLRRDGLFDVGRKRPLPPFPRRIGLITSPGGAAIRDVLRSIHRKFPAHVRIIGARVQGEGAADEIVRALRVFGRHRDLVEVVILARGGGSLEDLWTFNEERLVRAIAECPLPIITGVGHEIDVTLADLAADVRAQTPTHAGELVVPDFRQLGGALGEGRRRLLRALGRQVRGARDGVVGLGNRLRRAGPERELGRLQTELGRRACALKKGLYNRLREWEDRTTRFGEKLEALSPLGVLRRGYSVIRTPEGRIVRTVTEVHGGDHLILLLADGEVDARALAARKSRWDLPQGPRPEESSRDRREVGSVAKDGEAPDGASS